MRRCYLTGLEGDAITIVLAAAANLCKLLRRFCFALCDWLTRWLAATQPSRAADALAV